MKRATLALAAAAAALATPALAFEPAGELVLNLRGGPSAGASWDADHLVGPTVNLARTYEGGWAGDVRGMNADLTVTPDGIHGADVNLFLTRKGDKVTLRGNFGNQHLTLELTAKSVSGRFGDCSVDLSRRAPGYFQGELGCTQGGDFPLVMTAILKLAGNAADPSTAPMPQMALALLSVLPS